MSEDGSLRGVRSWPQRPGGEREGLVEAVIALAGERGFAELTVKAVCDRTGTHYRSFHRQFESLEDAFAEGYDRLAGALCEDLLAAGRSGEDWRTGFRAALRRFLAWVAANPAHAQVILSEYRLAGSQGWAAHKRLSERLERVTDLARAETPSCETPPNVAAVVLGAIEFTVGERIGKGEAAQVPELESPLAYFAVSVFFGAEVAEAELEA